MADDAVPLTEPRWTYQAGDTDISYLPHMITCLLESEVKSLSRVRLFVTPCTVAHQAPPSMGFSRQEYWSGLPLPSPGDLPDPGIEPRSPTLLMLKSSHIHVNYNKIREVTQEKDENPALFLSQLTEVRQSKNTLI